MGQTQIFATPADWLPILDALDRKWDLRYTSTATSRSSKPRTFGRGCDIPRLGVAADAQAGCESYLVRELEVEVVPRRVEAADGNVWFHFDQMLNPDTIELTPGGIWQPGTMIAGRIGTASDSTRSIALMRRFRAAVRRRFERFRAYAVGPEAAANLRAGWRLTHAVQMPSAYDLALE